MCGQLRSSLEQQVQNTLARATRSTSVSEQASPAAVATGITLPVSLAVLPLSSQSRLSHFKVQPGPPPQLLKKLFSRLQTPSLPGNRLPGPIRQSLTWFWRLVLQEEQHILDLPCLASCPPAVQAAAIQRLVHLIGPPRGGRPVRNQALTSLLHYLAKVRGDSLSSASEYILQTAARPSAVTRMHMLVCGTLTQLHGNRLAAQESIRSVS